MHHALTPSSYTLGQLVGAAERSAHATLAVNAVASDSREVLPGTVFFARSGARFTAADTARDAVARGAAAVVAADDEQLPELDAPVVRTTDFWRELGAAASRVCGDPSQALHVIGITGTNGKTTVATMVAQALHADAPCGLIGTLGSGFPDDMSSGTLTTPDVCALHRQFAEFRDAGARAAVMEVSSHGIAQGRTASIDFDQAAFTNLTRDHLDYHGSMEVYGETKARLFLEHAPSQAVINVDDAFGRTLLARLPAEIESLAYSLQPTGAACAASTPVIFARDVVDTDAGMQILADGAFGEFSLQSQLIGRFNASNLLAAAGLLLLGGMALEQVTQRLHKAQPARGRMQWFGGAGQPRVVVDYAHTPDALDSALRALRDSVTGELWCVFGCGGDRDPGKRPLMARVAEDCADRIVVTDDNPRSEESAHILDDILAGLVSRDGVHVIADRAQAIRHAIAGASAADTVLIAGKGHETYQERGGVRSHFDDSEYALDALRSWDACNATTALQVAPRSSESDGGER